jgi:PAS domain S-box-containing protein
MYSVIYVDDDPDLLDLAQLYLEDTGFFTIDKADSASCALQKLARQRYDAIISDFQMPRMDGIEFLKQVRQHFGNTPFILFTGRGREEVVIEAINNGADYYLQKGGEPDSLFAELTHKLRQAIQIRKDQATIRINEERLRRAQEIGQTGAWEYTIETRRMWGSDEGFRIFGINLPAGEVPVGLVETCIQKAEISRRALYDLIYHGTDYNIVYTINPADGSPPRVIRSIAELEKDDEGNPVKVLGIIRDITEKTGIQSALRKSEERFKDIYENAPVGIFRSTVDGKFIHANPALAQMLGYRSAGELIRRVNDSSIPEVIWEDPARRPDFIREVIEQNGWHQSERRFRCNDGRIIIVNLLYRTVINQFTGEMELEGFCADISDHKKAVEALTESETRFADVINNAGEWIWEVDADGVYRYSSPAGLQIHGFDADELVGKKHFYDLFVPEEREDFRQKAFEVFRQKKAFRHFINANIHKNGDTIILETSGTPVLDADGALLGYRGADLNITSRKRIEEDLVKNEARFRQLVHQLQDSVIILAYDGTILFGNPSAYTLAGISPRETVTGTHLSRFIDRDTWDQVNCDLKDITSGNTVRVSEYRIKTADNSTRWVEASGTRINYLDQDAIMVAIHDVTERRRAREELEMINKKLELLSSITRHDTINKITVILGNIRTAKKKCADPEILDVLNKLEAAAKSIRGLTEFTRIYQILGSHEPQWQSLDGIISQNSLPPDIRFESSIADIEIFADPMLEKVFYNLLDNSIQHGGHVTHIRFFTEPLPEGLRIVWEDNGSGIRAGDREDIFDRGFGDNTGLGLFLCREILAITGIGIREAGFNGKGARFEITIPTDHFRSGKKE